MIKGLTVHVNLIDKLKLKVGDTFSTIHNTMLHCGLYFTYLALFQIEPSDEKYGAKNANNNININTYIFLSIHFFNS